MVAALMGAKARQGAGTTRLFEAMRFETTLPLVLSPGSSRPRSGQSSVDTPGEIP